jgi:hypothetical protein
MRKICLHSYVIQKNRFTGLDLISSTGEQVELGLWFPTVLSDTVLDMYACGYLPHSKSTAIAKIIKQFAKVGGRGAVTPAEKLKLRLRYVDF